MGCTTSHEAFAAAASRARRPSSSSRARRGAADPAALCRERVALIRAAADRRFAFAAAHAAYFRSLAAVGGALRRFAEAALLPAATPPLGGSSPVLTLPPSPAKPVGASSAAAAATSSLPPSPSSSSSTVSPLSHSLSDDDDPLADARHARGRGSGKPPPPPKAASSSRHHYMRNSTTVPTVVYENPYGQYTEGETSYGYGYSYPYGPYGEVVAEERPETAPTPRGPPPSPPTVEASPWDFFDPFTPYDQFLEDYPRNKGEVDGNLPTNSPNYAELRRMEGIPELEDEAELEASKPSTSGIADRNVEGKRPVPTNAGSMGESSERKGSGANGEAAKPVSRNDSVPSNASSKSKKGSQSNTASSKGTDGCDIDGGSSTGKKKGLAFDEDRSIVAEEGNGGSHNKSMQSAVSSESFSPLHDGKRDVIEAMEEVKERFDEAMNCGAEISRLLEVGKVPHRTTPRVLRYLSSKVVDPLSLSVPSSSCLPKRHRDSRSSSSKAPTNSRRNGHGNLSSTLEKLCIWEKKLYQEVKVR